MIMRFLLERTHRVSITNLIWCNFKGFVKEKKNVVKGENLR